MNDDLILLHDVADAGAAADGPAGGGEPAGGASLATIPAWRGLPGAGACAAVGVAREARSGWPCFGRPGRATRDNPTRLAALEARIGRPPPRQRDKLQERVGKALTTVRERVRSLPAEPSAFVLVYTSDTLTAGTPAWISADAVALVEVFIDVQDAHENIVPQSEVRATSFRVVEGRASAVSSRMQ